MRGALLLAFAAASLPGSALAGDDPACARFEDPLAYNACLASRGPKAKEIGATPQGATARPAEPDGASHAAAPRPAKGPAPVSRRRGRIHMEFRLR